LNLLDSDGRHRTKHFSDIDGSATIKTLIVSNARNIETNGTSWG